MTETLHRHLFRYASGRLGAQDFYISHRRDKPSDLAWGPAENLGGAVNSEFGVLIRNYFESRGLASFYIGWTIREVFDVYASTVEGGDDEDDDDADGNDDEHDWYVQADGAGPETQ